MSAAYLRDLAHESAPAPAAIPVPPIPDEVHDVPMDAAETSRKRSAEALGPDAVALVEAYSPTGLQQRAGPFGLSAGVAMDLSLRWGLEADRAKAQKRFSDEKPYLLILSPMCLAFSQLQALNTKPERLGQNCCGRASVTWSLHAVESQIVRGGHVLFEHPWAATSGDEPCLKRLLAINGMRRVRCDQCQFGLTSVDDAGNVGPARKATGFMTNDEYIAAVDRRCFGGHDHTQCSNGSAKACEKYPPRLVAAILRVLRKSMRAARNGEAQGMTGRDRQLTIVSLELWRSRSCRFLITHLKPRNSETEALDCR